MTQDRIQFRDIVRGGIISVVIFLVIIYILFQARFLVVGPQIFLVEELPLRQNDRVITLTGTANNISHIWLNGRPIFTDPQGDFTTDVVLENGYTVTKLEAEDRYGRRTSLTREFVYVPMNFVQSN